MSLPYQSATSGTRAVQQIEKVLREFGCTKFGTMTDTEKGEVLVQFEYRGIPVSVRASVKGYAAALLKREPWSRRRTLDRVTYERRMTEQASVAVYSVLRDWIKGQVTAVETGILQFEGAFLGQILLPSGRTVLETVKMLPAPEQKVLEIKRNG